LPVRAHCGTSRAKIRKKQETPMCDCWLTRRGMLRLAGAGGAVLLTGCDEISEIDLVSEGQVEEMGLRAWQEIKSQTPVARNSEEQRLLNRVSSLLLKAAGEKPEQWEVLVFDRPEVNAFALPGRKIGVFQGMFRVGQNEDQLAAVVGHEIGHVQAEHGQERINAQVAKDWGLRLIAFLLQMGDVEFAAEIAAALGLGVEYGLVLPYSRSQELEADRFGIRLMAEAGYRPPEAIAFWQRMQAAGGAQQPEFLSTHPAPQSRIEELREMLGQLKG